MSEIPGSPTSHTSTNSDAPTALSTEDILPQPILPDLAAVQLSQNPVFFEERDPLRSQQVNSIIEELNELAVQAATINSLSPIMESEQIRNFVKRYDDWASSKHFALESINHIRQAISALPLAADGRDLLQNKLAMAAGELFHNPESAPGSSDGSEEGASQ